MTTLCERQEVTGIQSSGLHELAFYITENGNRRYRCTERPGNHSNLCNHFLTFVGRTLDREEHFSSCSEEVGAKAGLTQTDTDPHLRQLNTMVNTGDWSPHDGDTWWHSRAHLYSYSFSIIKTWAPQGSLRESKPPPNPITVMKSISLPRKKNKYKRKRLKILFLNQTEKNFYH